MIVTLPEGIKDSAELAQANGQAFGEKLSALLEEARPFEPSTTEDPPPRREESPPDPVSGGGAIHYTLRDPVEITNMEFDPGDLVLKTAISRRARRARGAASPVSARAVS
jgi:hypothetical protein